MPGEKIKVLNYGFVQLLDVMGSDRSISKAARISYDSFELDRKPSDDRHLLRYMMRHRHTSPFEMAEMQFRIRCPIFVARQWLRHRTANVNELSGRYSELPDEMELPGISNWRTQAKDNKQGSGVPADVGVGIQTEVVVTANCMHAVYKELINQDVALEQARVVLPLATCTEFVWKCDLHNLLHFLQLRMDPHAQQEIRQYAEVIAGIVADMFPFTWEAFEDCRLKAVTFSRMEMLMLKRLYAGASDFEGSGMSAREIKEFLAKAALITEENAE